MSFFINIYSMIKYLNTYVEERTDSISDLIEKGMYFDTEKHKDLGYIEIKVNNKLQILSMKI